MVRLLTALVLTGCSCATLRLSDPRARPTRVDAGRTHWVLEANEAYDALCLLNLLRGDAFYVQFLPQVYARWSTLLGEPEKRGLARITSEMVEKRKGLPSAKLTLAFSALPVHTTADLLEVVNDDAAWATLKKVHLARPDTEASDFDDVDAVRGDLRVMLSFLLRERFPERWRGEALPALEAAIAKSAPLLRDADVVGWNEQVLGRLLNIPSLQTEFLAFVRPHGIRANGWQFLTDGAWPVAVTEKTALHELLHPPYRREGALAKRLEALENDPYFQRLLSEHDRSFGYTTAHGFTEEDCAEAIDVYVSEQHGLLSDGRQPITGSEFFRLHDDGFHVPAFLIYRALGQVDWSHWTSYEDFLIRFWSDPSGLEARFRADPAHYPVKALGEP
jgi:hypothetical protein